MKLQKHKNQRMVSEKSGMENKSKSENLAFSSTE